jgi:integrase
MLAALIILLVETGLRVGREALPLKWQDIDFTNNVLYVRESKTLAGRRTVPFDDVCKDALLRWRDQAGPDVSEYLFFYPRDRRHLLKLPKTWATALKKAKIPYFPIYNLRHTFASRGDAAGISPVTLAQLLGHSSTGLLRTYALAVDKGRRDAIKKLAEYRLLKRPSEPAAQESDTSSD